MRGFFVLKLQHSWSYDSVRLGLAMYVRYIGYVVVRGWSKNQPFLNVMSQTTCSDLTTLASPQHPTALLRRGFFIYLAEPIKSNQ
jgi:hypothetical protein